MPNDIKYSWACLHRYKYLHHRRHRRHYHRRF